LTDYLQLVEAAIQATEFHSPTTYSWFGRQPPRLPPAIRRVLTPDTARSYLLFNLQYQLYAEFYCQGFASPEGTEAPEFIAPVSAASFVEELSAANSGTGHWEDGWEVCADWGDEVLVHRGDLKLRARPEDYLAPRGEQVRQGTRLRLRFPKESMRVSPGFYMALSNQEFPLHDSQGLVRVYWNLTAEGAVCFMRRATSLLNRGLLPFKLKVLSNPTQFTRCDAVVIYIRKSDHDVVSEILETIHPEVATSLRRNTPAFTKSLAEGVGLAEDPYQGESFGLHRCMLLAEGMIRAYSQGSKSLAQRLEVVNDCFAESGISLEKPYLNPGSQDIYSFKRLQIRLARTAQPPTAPGTVALPNAGLDVFLQTAHEVGSLLSQNAVWHKDRCNWMGADPEINRATNTPTDTAYKALGPEFYSGTAGVALFLAELYAHRKDAEVRNAALGAIRHALSRVNVVPPAIRLGLYTGWIGITLAASRVAMLLGQEELLERAARLLRRAIRAHLGEREFDLISGNAGAIAALVILQDMLDDASLLDVAARLGDEMLQTAEKSDEGYSWKSAAPLGLRNLTGFSHGAAGAGYALLELFHATGEPKYLESAELAFQYERHWFDPEAGNWPDFREEPGHSRTGQRRPSFAVTWCHGAPGIALSRLRAHEILGGEIYKAEAEIALQTTRWMVETSIRSGTGNYSLCHGLCGNAEALLYGSQVLGPERDGDSALAREVGNIGIKTYARRKHQWPCGIGGGETPNLMTGLAGIGYFYLRLYDTTTPSVLILRRESFQQKHKGSVAQTAAGGGEVGEVV
jgi:cell division protein ZapA (FtsZ GTPase activity inhibitor)